MYRPTYQLCKATLLAVLVVAKEFLHQRAILPPQVPQVFLGAYQTLQSDDTSDQIWIEIEIITDTRFLRFYNTA
jgi:hypothetical protein